MIRLEAIDETNWRYPLRVSEAQKAYVAGTAALLARAYAYRRLHSRAFLVCDGETPVGMGLYYDCPELDAYDLSQFLLTNAISSAAMPGPRSGWCWTP